MTDLRFAVTALGVLLLAACTGTSTPRAPGPGGRVVPPAATPLPDVPPEPEFSQASWPALPGWDVDDPREALAAFRKGCAALATRAPWQASCAAALAVPHRTDPAGARAFFEQWLQPWRVTLRGTEVQTGQVTGYYEPILRGSRRREGSFTTPLYGVPDDLVTIELGDLYPALKGERVRGRLVGRKVVPYPDRAR